MCPLLTIHWIKNILDRVCRRREVLKTWNLEGEINHVASAPVKTVVV